MSLLALVRASRARCDGPPLVLADEPCELANYAYKPPPDPPKIPDRIVWRSQLAKWPVEDRQRWGERANELEDEGAPWNLAEWRAFNEISGGPLDEPEPGRRERLARADAAWPSAGA